MSIALGHSWPRARLLPVSLPQQREQMPPFRSLERLSFFPVWGKDRGQSSSQDTCPRPLHVCVCARAHPERRLHSQVVPECDVQSRVYALGHYRDRRGACGGKGGKGESRPAGLQSLIWGSSQAAGRLRHESTRATGAVGGQRGGRLVASFPLDTPHLHPRTWLRHFRMRAKG